MGPTQLSTQDHGKRVASVFEMEEEGLSLFSGSENPPKHAENPPLKRKKGPAPKMLGNEVCSVCGDKASGFHYNVLSCEGCKGFFRRSVIKGAQYVCKNGGKCEMDMYMRRKCQECRLRKCQEAGMREQYVLSEEQIRLKKLKKQEDDQARTVVVRPNPPQPPSPSHQLTPEQLNMIEKLVAAQQQCNQRSFTDRLKVTPWPQVPDPNNREARQQRFAHFTELAIISVQEIVDFAKQLPGFRELTREDQIALLKTSTIEVMLLETSRRYNPEIESITFLKDLSYNRDDFAKAGLQFEFINPIFEFSKGMNELQLNDAEYALLIAINIFSADRPNVQDQSLVERLQHTYVEALHSYICINRPNDHLMFPRMLMKLVSLRTLSSVHSEQGWKRREKGGKDWYLGKVDVVEGSPKLPRIWSIWHVFQGECEDVLAKERGHTALSEICGHCTSYGLHNSQIVGCRNIECYSICLHLLPHAKVFPRYFLEVPVIVMGCGGPCCMRSANCFRRTLGSCILSSRWAQ